MTLTRTVRAPSIWKPNRSGNLRHSPSAWSEDNSNPFS